MDRLTNKDMTRDVAVFSLLLSICMTGESQSQPASPAKLPPEIVALMPSGIYVGRGVREGKGIDVSLDIQETKPGGKFAGTALVHEPRSPCGAVFPIRGEMNADGAIRIDSREGVTRGCERKFDLKLAGDQLTGTMLASEGTFEVSLKKR